MKKTALLITLLLLTCLALSAETKAAATACEKNAQVLLDKVLEMWNKGNLALVPDVYCPDIVVMTSSMPEPYVGHEGVKKWVENTRTMLPDLVMAFPEVIAKGDQIVTVWTMSGTQTGPMVMPGGTLPPTGRKVSITGMSIDHLRNGKFAKEVVVFNMLEMLMPLGFQLQPPAPPPPPPPAQ